MKQELTDAALDALLIAHGKGDDGFHGFARAAIKAHEALQALGGAQEAAKAEAMYRDAERLLTMGERELHAENAALTKQANAYKTLTESLDARNATLLSGRAKWREAVNTLASERQANAMLTGEIAALRSALERVAAWDLPVSYTLDYGSNGARDFMRNIAREALAQAVQPG